MVFTRGHGESLSQYAVAERDGRGCTNRGCRGAGGYSGVALRRESRAIRPRCRGSPRSNGCRITSWEVPDALVYS